MNLEVFLDGEEVVELVLRTHKVVGGVFYLPVLIAVEVVPQETHALHVGEESYGER